MLNLIKYRYKNFKTQKLSQIELKRRTLRILRELVKTYLKILIKIKA
jgi:hypothetical protein